MNIRALRRNWRPQAIDASAVFLLAVLDQALIALFHRPLGQQISIALKFKEWHAKSARSLHAIDVGQKDLPSSGKGIE